MKTVMEEEKYTIKSQSEIIELKINNQMIGMDEKDHEIFPILHVKQG
jgi:hypothetical protein